MRKRVQDFTSALPAKAIDLGSMARLPGDYVAGHSRFHGLKPSSGKRASKAITFTGSPKVC